MGKALRSAEVVLWTAGLLCTGTLLMNKVEASAAQTTAAAFGSGAELAAIRTVTSSASAEPSKPAHSITRPDQVLGRMEIPALRLSTPIVDDDDMNSLLLGAGHIRGTALPGGLGNFVVAAHRDTYFRPLQGIKPGMKIRVVTADDTFVYMVDSTKIVDPKDVDVLDMGDVPEMTLITCYPFHYIGAAPKRFTVRAHLISY